MKDQQMNGKDEDFLLEWEEKLIDFLECDEETIHLEPMNSYYRRLVHNLGMKFKFESYSEGTGKDRHIILTKSEDSVMPERMKKSLPIVWNYGDREFLVNPLQSETEIFLGKDGSVGLFDESVKDYITRKKVVSGTFKIKMNKIVELYDDEW